MMLLLVHAQNCVRWTNNALSSSKLNSVLKGSETYYKISNTH